MQNWIHDPNAERTAESMIRLLANRCNHASSLDGAGFSMNDASFGHSLAQQSASGRPWTEKQAAAALRIIAKYSGQLGGREAIQQWLKNPVFENMPRTGKAQVQRRISCSDGVVMFSFAYDTELVNTIKGTFSKNERNLRPWFDPATKNWYIRLSPKTVDGISEIAKRHGFEIDVDLQEHLDDVIERTSESRTMLVLNDGRHVVLNDTHITIAVDDLSIMQEFERALGIK